MPSIRMDQVPMVLPLRFISKCYYRLAGCLTMRGKTRLMGKGTGASVPFLPKHLRGKEI